MPIERPTDNGSTPEHSESHAEPRPITLEGIARAAKEVALREGGHAPTLIAEGSTGSIVGQLRELPDTHAGRANLLFQAGFLLGRNGEIGALKQAYFISEAWMSQAASDGSIQQRPSQDPDRTEVLLVSQIDTKTQHHAVVLFEMLRDETGELRDLKEMPPMIDPAHHLDSPLLDAFALGFLSGWIALD